MLLFAREKELDERTNERTNGRNKRKFSFDVRSSCDEQRQVIDSTCIDLCPIDMTIGTVSN
jgi:hypothetical protein